MPVTDLLSNLRTSTARSRRRPATGRALALAAALGVSLTVVNAVGPDETGTASAAEIADTKRDVVDAEGNMVEFTAFTPREAQMPQIVPEAVLWEQHRLAVEAARPKTVRPVAGVLTSTFGARWGAMHAGLDFGDPTGAPIAAVTDGVVIEAGPASGFGLWVRIQQDDGSIGVYGHMNDILVSAGQPVRAGDVIATVGSRGYSTGPHLHFEVHLPGIGPIDPAGWLGARGIDVYH